MVSKELVAASTRPMILAILAQEESYGYAIIQRVRELSNGQLEWSEGMLYPVLHRLEQEKVIISRWGKSEQGRRRKYYRLSVSGFRTMSSERQQWSVVQNTLNKLWEGQPCLT